MLKNVCLKQIGGGAGRWGEKSVLCFISEGGEKSELGATSPPHAHVWCWTDTDTTVQNAMIFRRLIAFPMRNWLAKRCATSCCRVLTSRWVTWPSGHTEHAVYRASTCWCRALTNRPSWPSSNSKYITTNPLPWTCTSGRWLSFFANDNILINRARRGCFKKRVPSCSRNSTR